MSFHTAWGQNPKSSKRAILVWNASKADAPEWSAPVFRSDSLNRRGSNAKLLSNLQDAWPILSPEGLANSNFCFLIDPRPTELLSFCFGSCKPGSYSLLDHRPLEFSEYSHHLEHRLSGGRGGVQTLLVKVQIDFERVNFREELYQILQRSAEAIDAPCHNCIELALSSVMTEPIELRSFISALRAAYPVITIDFDDLTAHSRRDLPKFPFLVGGSLVER
jgi:hypothetical protein